ncbi:hypothetical protein EYF80_045821 [Liparis tanakae]|uniref:Transmembrane protein n=1 Tax=Liparis tanakae TaxID=230148 RepID=A0A4Z2FTA4_9TELE|nr:hypothetical protein EYF80_045821 [Liparis tanakae]
MLFRTGDSCCGCSDTLSLPQDSQGAWFEDAVLMLCFLEGLSWFAAKKTKERSTSIRPSLDPLGGKDSACSSAFNTVSFQATSSHTTNTSWGGKEKYEEEPEEKRRDAEKEGELCRGEGATCGGEEVSVQTRLLRHRLLHGLHLGPSRLHANTVKQVVAAAFGILMKGDLIWLMVAFVLTRRQQGRESRFINQFIVDRLQSMRTGPQRDTDELDNNKI